MQCPGFSSGVSPVKAGGLPKCNQYINTRPQYPHEKFSPKAKAFMVKVSQEKTKAEIPAVVIVECVYVMEKFYRIPKHEIADTLSRILNFQGLPIRTSLKSLKRF